MKNRTFLHRSKRYANFLKIGISMLFFFCLFSCSQKTETPIDLSKSSIQIPNTNPTNLPPPIQGKVIPLNEVQPPIVSPLKGKPKVIPAHPNIHLAGTPKLISVPKNIEIMTIGKGGIPLPTKRKVAVKKVPALHGKPVPAVTPTYKEPRMYDIQSWDDEQNIRVWGGPFLEDSRGQFWMNGETGVLRYDGENFFQYGKDEGFLWGGVTSILEDRKGNIWFAAPSGVCYYDGIHFVHLDLVEGYGWQRYRGLMEDREGNIWFAKKKVYRYDGTQLTIFDDRHGLIPDPAIQDDVDNYWVSDILEDSQGNIWWLTRGFGALKYDGQTITRLTTKEGLIDNFIVTAIEDSQGNIWFGSGGWGVVGKGVSRYQPTKNSFTNFTKQEGLSNNIIQDILEDRKGNIWLSTDGGGIMQYDGIHFIYYGEEEGIGYESANHLFEDAGGNIWTNLDKGGLKRIKPNGFYQLKGGLKLGGSYPAKEFYEDEKGNIWIPTNYGVMAYNGENYTCYTESEGLFKNRVSSITGDEKGNIWMGLGLEEYGLVCFDGKSFIRYDIEQGLHSEDVWDILIDAEGFVWSSAGRIGGFSRLNPDTGEFTHFKGAQKDGLGGLDFFMDSQQNVYMGGLGAIGKYDAAKNQVRYLYQNQSVEKWFIIGMVEDEDNNVWFGGQNQLFHLNTKTEVITKRKYFPMTDKEAAQLSVGSLTKDKKGNVWIGSTAGLLVLPDGFKEDINKQANYIYYDKHDGMRKLGYDGEGTLIDSKNRYWIGGSSLINFDLNTFELPSKVPKKVGLSHIDIQQQYLSFERLKDTTYRQNLSFGEALSTSFDSIVPFENYPTSLKLPYDLNHLTFHFATIDLSAPHKIQYSFKMEELDDNWSPTQSEAKADYRNLPYGTFTFKVKAIGEANIWSEPFAYSFTILPPWWHTWWAYGLYALLTIGITGWYIQRLRRQINQKQQQLDKEQYLNQELAVTNKQLADINVANSRFVPNDFLQILGKESLLDLQLGDQIATKMTILFADIRDYTTLSEKITPEENFKFINAFLGRMGPIIQQHGGFISQYMGDGIMALFKDNHELAVKAAIEMQKAIQQYNKKRFAQNRQAIRLGIGLNTGQLMLGVIGDENRYESSVISDAVNTASRMEGLTKIFGCSVIISESTLVELLKADEKDRETSEINLLDNGKLSSKTNYRFLGKIKVKGKSQIIKIFDCYEGDSEHICNLKAQTKANFEKAIHFYFDRKFGKAADLLKVIARKFPEDIATEYYLTKAVKYVIDGVDADWNGVETMTNK